MGRKDHHHAVSNKEDKLLQRVLQFQTKTGVRPSVPSKHDRIGFVFSTRERVDYSVRSLERLDTESVDIVWIDGSDTTRGRAFAAQHQLRKANVLERHLDITGGPDATIRFGLQRLLDLGYDYCGLIENDVLLQPGWLAGLLNLFQMASFDGIAVGAATVRTYACRILEYRSGYALVWNLGAGMAFFPKAACEIILDDYRQPRARQIQRFYAETFGLDIGDIWELRYGFFDRNLGADWYFGPRLYSRGYASVCSLPSMAVDLDLAPEETVKHAPTSQERKLAQGIRPVHGAKVWGIRAADVCGGLGAAVYRRLGKQNPLRKRRISQFSRRLRAK